MFLQRIRAAARNLKRFPQLGALVEDMQDSNYRQVVVGSHRIIYLCRDNQIEIVRVYHGARILRQEELESD
jgi:plasmid stabilization system protein ParE